MTKIRKEILNLQSQKSKQSQAGSRLEVDSENNTGAKCVSVATEEPKTEEVKKNKTSINPEDLSNKLLNKLHKVIG